MGLERRGRAGQIDRGPTHVGEELSDRSNSKVKSFGISKRLVFEAWEKVRANRGAPGVDAVGVAEFAAGETDNLYRLWNRMSSGSYMPGAVRAVEIPKDHGMGVRTLGVPNVADRVAQTAAAMLLEDRVEPVFHPDSFGYRPGRSALDAVAQARKRCWSSSWVVDLDIRAFFDSVPHDLVLKAVAAHTSERWVLLYIDRWMKAPMSMPDGTLTARKKGTPQGSPISPLLANVFMHYAFDRWMDREYPGCRFERYADDIVVHCATEDQARAVRASIALRLEALGLELHPDKTKIVYCKDANRRGTAEHTSFDFLGYTFRGRLAKGPRGRFISFSPAMSAKAKKAVGAKVRAWRLTRRSDTDLFRLARELNAQIRGWINYYGAFYPSELSFLVRRINGHIVRWAMHKFKRLRRQPARAWAWFTALQARQPRLFVHWPAVAPTVGRPARAG